MIFSTYLIKIGWDGFGIAPETWTILMIIIATIINLYVTWKHQMSQFAFVCAWALIAIAVANSDSKIVTIAYLAAVKLIISSLVYIFKNRKNYRIQKN